MTQSKKRPAKKRANHRPRVEIDWKKVDSYLQAQCNGTAIASILGCHPDTLYRHCEELHGMTFTAYSQIKRAEGVELLRVKMYSSAMSGDKTMQIWLSKQYLDMKDRHEQSTPDDGLDINVRILRAGDQPTEDTGEEVEDE